MYTGGFGKFTVCGLLLKSSFTSSLQLLKQNLTKAKQDTLLAQLKVCNWEIFWTWIIENFFKLAQVMMLAFITEKFHLKESFDAEWGDIQNVNISLSPLPSYFSLLFPPLCLYLSLPPSSFWSFPLTSVVFALSEGWLHHLESCLPVTSWSYILTCFLISRNPFWIAEGFIFAKDYTHG